VQNRWNEEILKSLPEKGEEVEIFETVEKVPTVRIKRKDNTKIFLHSSVRPLLEAKKIAERLNLSNDIIIIAGFGLGYIAEEIIKQIPPFSPDKGFPVVIIFEHNPSLLKTVLDIRPDIKKLFEDIRVNLFLNMEELLSFIEALPTRRVTYFFHRPYFELYSDLYSSFRERLLTQIHKKNINIATLSRFEKLWTVNIATNLKYFLSDPGIKTLEGKFKNIPAVLVAAGPSLDRHISFLKRIRKKVLLVCVDAVLSRLLYEGIDPDIVFSVDPQIFAFYFFYLCRNYNSKAILIYEPSCHRKIPAFWKGGRLTFDTIFPLIKWLSNITGEKGMLDMGGSVSTSAFDFILLTEAEPIILIGQDMAFNSERTHARGSLVEYFLRKSTSRTENIETKSYKLAHSRISTSLKSNSGKKVLSDRRLLLFYWWFKDKIKRIKKDIQVWTLAEDAAQVEGILLKKEDDVEILISNRPDFIFPCDTIKPLEVTLEIKKKILTEIEETVKNLNYICRKAQEGINLSETLYESLKEKRDPSFFVLSGLDKIDSEIKKKQKTNTLIAMTMQKAIFSITEGHDDFLTDEEKKDEKLATARRSIVLYEEILKSSSLNKSLLEKFLSELQNF